MIVERLNNSAAGLKAGAVIGRSKGAAATSIEDLPAVVAVVVASGVGVGAWFTLAWHFGQRTNNTPLADIWISLSTPAGADCDGRRRAVNEASW